MASLAKSRKVLLLPFLRRKGRTALYSGRFNLYPFSHIPSVSVPKRNTGFCANRSPSGLRPGSLPTGVLHVALSLNRLPLWIRFSTSAWVAFTWLLVHHVTTINTSDCSCNKSSCRVSSWTFHRWRHINSVTESWWCMTGLGIARFYINVSLSSRSGHGEYIAPCLSKPLNHWIFRSSYQVLYMSVWFSHALWL